MIRLLALLGFGLHLLAAQSTFQSDVAPIVYSACAPCHHPGGLGPFPLTTYDEVRKHASQIAAVTATRYMPPWPPDAGVGDFIGDRHLTTAQIRTISEWVRSGAPKGNGPDPKPLAFGDEGWQMGKPDAVLSMPAPFNLPAAGPDLFRNFVIPSGLHETRYIRALELRLNTKRGVHHANVVLDRTRSLRHRDGEDGAPGFPGMDVVTEAAANEFDPDSHFLFWKPASVLRPEPDARSWRLDPHTDLILNLHLQPTGKPELIRAEVGLYFASGPPTELPMLLQLEQDGAIRIPPGSRDFSVNDHLVLPVPVKLLAIYPHAHYLGKRIEATATLPNGTVVPLIRISNWDINWQATYEYRHPIDLPAGTRVSMRVTYDNSEENPRNPNRPPRLVTSGDRSQDEMGHVWLQVLPTQQNITGQDPRWPLQEAIMRRRLEKYPNDFLANYNLGAFLQDQGRLPEAEAAYTRAATIEPRNVTALNSLGAIYLLEQRPAEAKANLTRALELDPTYESARYNLGRVLAVEGDLAGAVTAFGKVVADNPDDAAAQADLAVLLIREKKYAEAKSHLIAATRLNPRDADSFANLGTIMAITGDLPGAVSNFEAALRVNPGQQAAKRNLEHARIALARGK